VLPGGHVQLLMLVASCWSTATAAIILQGQLIHVPPLPPSLPLYSLSLQKGTQPLLELAPKTRVLNPSPHACAVRPSEQ
jgi:hypothetical protein